MPSGTVSILNSILYSGVNKGVAGQQSGLRNLTNFLFGQKRLTIQAPGLSSALPYSSILLSDTSKPTLYKRKHMAASSSKAVFGDVHVDDLFTSGGNALELVKPTGILFNDRSCSRFPKAIVSFKRTEPTNNFLVRGKVVVDVTRRNYNYHHLLIGTNNLHTLSSACFAAGPTSDVSLDGSSQDEEFANSTILSNQAILGERNLKLLSGSCYLPHPAKEKTGGEDAHFICKDEQVIGVADGVGGWADVGVDSGKFARELMSNSVSAIREEPMGSIDPAKVLEKAHSGTKAKGSSTACIITLSEKGIHAINLGDSGFIVVRDGSTIFRSPVQQHGFNFTYQLESGNGGDLPSSGQVFTIPVEAEDVIVAGTDGLFDNLYDNEIASVVANAVRSGSEPQVASQILADLARERALDRKRQTPFSTAAQEAGFHYYGGKLDDITVVVSCITSSSRA